MKVTALSNAIRWFTAALADTRAADTLSATPQPHEALVCFHCHMAVEQMLKGLIAFHEGEPPATHLIAELLPQAKQKSALAASIADDALIELDKYIDDVYTNGVLTVSLEEMRASVQAMNGLKALLSSKGYPLPE